MNTSKVGSKKGFYHQIYMSKVTAAISACEAVAKLPHSGEKGRIREILIRDLFRPLLPNDIGIGTGFILSASGQISNQQDIVIYDRSTLPPAMIDDSTGFFPIESAIHTIEVKSVLTRHELEAAHQSAAVVAALPLAGIDGNPTKEGPRPAASIFAIATDLVSGGKSEADRYNEIRTTQAPFIGSICVVRREYWWFNNNQFNKWPEKQPYAEVIGFMTGILNGISRGYEARRAARPPIGAYLANYGADITYLSAAMNDLEAAFRPRRADHTLADLQRFHVEAMRIAAATNEAFDCYVVEGRLVELQRLMLKICTSIAEEILADMAVFEKNPK